jgi:hypothetical protein
MAAPTLVDTPAHPSVKAFVAKEQEYKEFLANLEDWIFSELTTEDPNVVGGVVGRISQAPLAAAGSPTHGDAVAEVANALAAAAAIQTKSYDPLVGVVTGLAKLGGEGNKWGTIPFQVAQAALLRFKNQANLFLLKLIEVGPENGGLDLYVIYKFLRNQQSAGNAAFTITFLYFAPELLAGFPAFFQEHWKEVAGIREAEGSFVKVINCGELPGTRDVTVDKFDAFKAKRATGKGEDPLLNAIREDDDATFTPFLASHDLKQRIPFSIYEQFFHYEYIWKQTDSKWAVERPEFLHAIALFGAANCFNIFLQDPSPDVSERVKAASSSIASNPGFFGRAQEYGASVGGEALRSMVRYHKNESVESLLATVNPAGEVIGDSLVYANFTAFTQFLLKGFGEAFHGEKVITPLHYAAKGNAIAAFKTLLSKGPVNPYAVTSTRRSFLHWAASYGAWEIAEFWVTNFKEIGLDQVDEKNLGPAGVAYRALTPKPDDKTADISLRKPLFDLLQRATGAAEP